MVMHLQKQRLLLQRFLRQQLNSKNDQAKNEDRQADAVDAVPVSYPF